MYKRIIYSALMFAFFQLPVHSLKAQNCDAFFKEWVNIAKEQGQGNIGFTIVAIGANGSWGQFAEGTLHYTPSSTSGKVATSALLSGEGLQYFSDRSTGSSWFSKDKADRLKIEIPVSSLGFQSKCRNPVTLTLLTWGNAKSTFCPSCYGQNMYLLDNGMLIVFRKVPVEK